MVRWIYYTSNGPFSHIIIMCITSCINLTLFFNKQIENRIVKQRFSLVESDEFNIKKFRYYLLLCTLLVESIFCFYILKSLNELDYKDSLKLIWISKLNEY